MDVDEEPSSYLNYLNDGDTPNTFFLGDNEVMLERMFMDVTDWPTGGFSVLQSNPIASENSTRSIPSIQKAPLILTEENCALVTTANNSGAELPTNLLETCTIIAENGTEQKILVDKNFGIVAANAQNIENNSFGVNSPSNNQKKPQVIIKKKILNDKQSLKESKHTKIDNFNITEKSVQDPNGFNIACQGLENSIGSFGVIAINNENNLVANSSGVVAAFEQGQNSEYSNLNIQTIGQNFCTEIGNEQQEEEETILDEEQQYSQEEPKQLDFQNFTPQIQNSEDDIQNFKPEFEVPGNPNSEAHLENADAILDNAEAALENTNLDFTTAEAQQFQITDLDFQNAKLVYQRNDSEYLNGDNKYEIQPNSTTYINYDPIVKEKENGLREIYLTEKDIFNDAKVIQLLNSDGSIITIDKTLLHSIDVYKPHKSVLKPIQVVNNVPEKPPDIRDFYRTVTAVKCQICGFLAEKTDDVIAHILEDHSDKLGVNPLQENEEPADIIHMGKRSSLDKKDNLEYVCKFCKEVSFSSKTLRNEHYKKVHSKDIEAKERSKQSLKDILENLIKQQQKALKKYKCSVQGCIATLPTEELRIKHQKMHVADRRNHFKCPDCSEKFFAWRLARSHMLKKHQEDFGTLICPMCSKFKTFSTPALRAHMNGHKEDDQSFLCPICDQGFPSYNKMKNHKAYHDQPSDPSDVSGWPILQKCDLCGITFNYRKNLKAHIRDVHQNYRPYVCKICGHKTTRKAMLDLHIRQHTGVKPYKCLYCEFRSGDHNCLRRHLMTHVDATKQYTCPHCPYSCIQTVTLKSHIRVKHPNRSGVYRCKHCSYTSINLQSYRVHEKSHELGKKGRLVNQLQIINVAIRVPERETKTDTDEETQNCFYEEQQEEEPIDTGGITIPAGFELPILDICEDTAAIA